MMSDNNSKYTVILPKGNSMKPFIVEGDSVIVQKSYDNIKKYDIVLFENDNGLVLHRVIKLLDNKRFLVCGDNQTTTEIINENQVVGVAKGIEKNGKVYTCDGVITKLTVRLWCVSPLRRLTKKIMYLIREGL